MEISRESLQAAMNDTDAIGRAIDLFSAMAQVECIRPVVEEYQCAILEENQWHIDKKWVGKRGMVDRVVTSPSETYLLSSGDQKKYLELLHDAHLSHGFDVEKNYCPLLIAQSKVTECEHELVKVMEKYTGISLDKLITSTHNRKRYLELLKKMFATRISEIQSQEGGE